MLRRAGCRVAGDSGLWLAG